MNVAENDHIKRVRARARGEKHQNVVINWCIQFSIYMVKIGIELLGSHVEYTFYTFLSTVTLIHLR